MNYLKIDPLRPSDEVIKQAAGVLESGGVIVYPTDTLYGLGVDITNQQAMEKLYEIKMRPARLPVSMMTCSINGIEEVSGLLPIETHYKLTKLFPGKFTVLLKNTLKDSFPAVPGIRRLDKIGWRVPDHIFCRELIQQFGRPVSTTSANISGTENISDPGRIAEQLGDRVDLVIDAGPLSSKAGSTVLDFTKNPILMVREGDIPLSEIKSLLPKSDIRAKKDLFKIVFVCSGNICRSPMAEGILKQLIEKTKFKDIIDISSAGTLNLARTPAHILAVGSAEENGVDIHQHVSHQITVKIVDEAELIIAMSMNHLSFLQKEFPEHKHKLVLLKQWHSPKKLSNPSVADPIGRDSSFFAKTFREIQRESERVLPYILKELKRFIEYNGLTITPT